MIDEKYLKEFTREIDLPNEATEELAAEFRLLTKESENFDALCRLAEEYDSGGLSEGLEFYESLKAISKNSKVNFFSLQLLFLLSLTPRLRELYDMRGYGEERFLDSVHDLKWKIAECKRMYNVWGSFVSWWQINFFRLTIFGIGRLQFETMKSDYEYSDGVNKITKGCDVLSVHIPSSGKLDHEQCLASYAEAEKFFRKFFPERYGDAPIPFFISSWLVYPANRKILGESSNIVRFMNDFDVFDSYDSKDDLWRIFNRDDYKDNPDEMPCETSLQRAYIKWLKEGNNVGDGIGVFFFKDGKILKNL